jgi:hypothetical protein
MKQPEEEKEDFRREKIKRELGEEAPDPSQMLSRSQPAMADQRQGGDRQGNWGQH